MPRAPRARPTAPSWCRGSRHGSRSASTCPRGWCSRRCRAWRGSGTRCGGRGLGPDLWLRGWAASLLKASTPAAAHASSSSSSSRAPQGKHSHVAQFGMLAQARDLLDQFRDEYPGCDLFFIDSHGFRGRDGRCGSVQRGGRKGSAWRDGCSTSSVDLGAREQGSRRGCHARLAQGTC